jgi:hypothetical protein
MAGRNSHMYTHEITQVNGKYQLTVYNTRKVPIYREEVASERDARNGLIRFMYRGPNIPGAYRYETAGIAPYPDELPSEINGEDY